MRLSKGVQVSLALLAMSAAVAVAVGLWAWWLSFDRPSLFPRPHVVVYEAISLAQRDAGLEVAVGQNALDDNPLIRLFSYSIKTFGSSYQAMACAQIPFMALLILSAGFLAWRFGGPAAAALASIVAAFAPMTVGLGVCIDDLLDIQALNACALALVAWSDVPRKRWLGFVAAIPMALSIPISCWFTNGLISLGIFAMGAFSILAWQWWRWKVKIQGRPRLSESPIWGTIGAVVAFCTSLWLALPIPVKYLTSEAANTEFAYLNVLKNVDALSALPSVWYFYLVTPILALLALLAGPAAFWGKKFYRLLPMIGWLVLPMIFFTVMNKRHDFYLVTIVAPTYVLISLGVVFLPKRWAQIAAAIIVLALLPISWKGNVSAKGLNEEALWLSKVFEGTPFPYLSSPNTNLMPIYDDVGQLLVEHCSKEKRPVLFVDSMGLDGWLPFYVWRADPNLLINDLREGPLSKPDGSCILARYNLENPEPGTLETLLEDYRVKVTEAQKFAGHVKKRYEILKQSTHLYRPVKGMYGWALFVPQLDEQKL